MGSSGALEGMLIAAACEHQRAVWVHPFLDGNGRASRLQLHAMLHRLTGGLWSANRGFARKREDYYARLSEADMSWQGDYDGRGNLSEKALLPLHHILAAGPLTRGEFVQMTGLADRTGRKVLSKLIEDGLLKSDTAKGPVRIGFPLDSLYILFPNLYPEAHTAVLDA